MDSARAWPPREAVASSLRAATGAASAPRPDGPAIPLPGSGKIRRSPPPRLRKREEFLAVRRGEKRRRRLFLLEVLDRGDMASARVGYTVTKKVGNAVERNRVRRRLKEALRTRASLQM